MEPETAIEELNGLITEMDNDLTNLKADLEQILNEYPRYEGPIVKSTSKMHDLLEELRKYSEN